jgi:hypothetical protein
MKDLTRAGGPGRVLPNGAAALLAGFERRGLTERPKGGEAITPLVVARRPTHTGLPGGKSEYNKALAALSPGKSGRRADGKSAVFVNEAA